jgi:hypothetical protein
MLHPAPAAAVAHVRDAPSNASVVVPVALNIGYVGFALPAPDAPAAIAQQASPTATTRARMRTRPVNGVVYSIARA